MKLLVGTIPNLPWWRLKNMTEKEIEEFNRKHMVEIKMSEKPTDKQINDATNKILDQYGKDMWNAAINAAQAELAEKFVAPEVVIEIIGNLKK